MNDDDREKDLKWLYMTDDDREKYWDKRPRPSGCTCSSESLRLCNFSDDTELNRCKWDCGSKRLGYNPAGSCCHYCCATKRCHEIF